MCMRVSVCCGVGCDGLKVSFTAHAAAPAVPAAVRPFFLSSLDMFHQYQRMEEGAIGGGGSQAGAASRGASQQQQQPARQLRAAGALR